MRWMNKEKKYKRKELQCTVTGNKHRISEIQRERYTGYAKEVRKLTEEEKERRKNP